jgi:pimeloyl-ACP methyl ester carboxylesterase
MGVDYHRSGFTFDMATSGAVLEFESFETYLYSFVTAMRVITLIFCSLLLTSCGLLGLRRQVESLEAHGGVTVHVTPPPADKAPTYALAWRMENGTRKDSAGFQQVRPDGLASFNLNLDSVYRVGAFTDENGNRAYDAGEPLDFVRDVRPIPLSDPNAQPKIWKLTLRRDHGLPAGSVIELPQENKTLGGRTNLALGDVASIDEERFAPDTGVSGLWRPLDFLGGNTVGIYFTEPYDPKRIPVVLVYGIGGSPQDWRYFIQHFNRTHHQLWFFHYPSGMRLDRVAGVLAEGLRLLKQRHGFSKCYIVAHSMGGLVSRAAITEAVAAERVNFIPRFVSISTPWGGHKAAEAGIRHLKKPVPSWLDVRPGSDFLLKIYATPLPEGTTHHLIYGSIEGGPFWMKEANDGVVTVKSETDLRIKRSTSSIKHLIHEHTEILNQPATVARVERLLTD